MRRGVVLWMVAVVGLLGAASTRAYEVHELSDAELEREMAQNRTLSAYVRRNGMPDVAEAHFLSDRPPWDDHEVTLYYLGMRKEIGFARAYILGRPEVQIERYSRPLTDEQVAALSTRVRRHGVGPTERAEEAARRAEQAADRIEGAVASAEQAADRAEAIAGKMERGFHRALRK